MARGEYTESLVTFHPVGYKLVTNSHRASLDKNAVSVLSGVDPKEFGSIGRWPGSKTVSATYPNCDGYPYTTKFLQRRGFQDGHIPQGGTTSFADSTTVTLSPSAYGFQKGDWIFAYVTNAANKQCLAKITSAATDKLVVSSTAHGTRSIANASIIRIASFGLGVSGENYLAFSAGYMPMEIRPGQRVRLYRLDSTVAGDPVGVDEIPTISTITYDTGTSTWRVTFTASISAARKNNATPAMWVLCPTMKDLDNTEAWLSTSHGEIFSISAGVITEVTTSSMHTASSFLPYSVTPYDRGAIVGNGSTDPLFYNGWGGFDRIGFMPEAPELTSSMWSVATGGKCSAGSHYIFLRLVDKSVYPNIVSSPIGMESITISANTAVNVAFGNFVSVIATNSVDHLYYTRATDFEVWMTPAGGGTYFLAASGHINQLKEKSISAPIWSTAGGASTSGSTNFFVSISDTNLTLRKVLDQDNDLDKGLIPIGRCYEMYQGMLFVGGLNDDDWPSTSILHPKIKEPNVLYFSRVDKPEPWNFPGENVQPLGNNGDRILGFVKAGDLLLALTDFGFTVIQKMGQYLSIKDTGIPGYGLAHDQAFCSMGSHAVWVGRKNVWLFDSGAQGYPTDIGWEIADWLGALTSANPGDRVRVTYDAVERLLYVGMIDVGVGGDVMCYSFDDQAWSKVEDLILDAPFSGLGIESWGTGVSPIETYCWNAGEAAYAAAPLPFCHKIRDTTKLVRGGFDASTYKLAGTILGTDYYSKTALWFQQAGATTHPADNNGLRGAIVRFSDGQRSIVQTSSWTLSGTWVKLTFTALANTPTLGLKYVIGGIPFRLRFPVVRGEQPFFTKIAKGFTTIWDNVSIPTLEPNPLLTVNLLSDFRDDPITTGGMTSGTLAIGDSAGLTDVNHTTNVETTGKIIEVEVENEMDHCDFSMIYAGLKVTQPGTVETDRSTSV